MAANDRSQSSHTTDSNNNIQNRRETSEFGEEASLCDLEVSWDTISELGILVKTGDGTSCGNVISTYKDNIIVIDFGKFRLLNEYIIPISRIKKYDGKYIYLSVPNETTLKLYVY